MTTMTDAHETHDAPGTGTGIGGGGGIGADGDSPHGVPPRSQAWEMQDTTIVGVGLAIAAVAATIAQFSGVVKIQAVCGLIVILLIAYLWSTNRRAIDRRTVAWGLTLQIIFALIVLKTNVGQWTFATLGAGITRLLGFADVGAAFVFGPLGDK